MPETKEKTPQRSLKSRVAKAFIFLLAFLLFIFFTLWMLIKIPSVQNWAMGQVASMLSKKYKTTVTVGHVDLKLFKTVSIENIFVADQQNDTLFYIGNTDASISMFSLFSKTIELSATKISNVKIYFSKKMNHPYPNFKFFFDAMASDTSQPKKEIGFHLDATDISLKNVHFNFNKEGLQILDVFLKNGTIKMNDINLQTGLVDVKSLELTSPVVSIVKLGTDSTPLPENDTAIVHLNTKKFHLLASSIKIKDGVFSYEDHASVRDSSRFDAKHMLFSNLQSTFKDVSFIKDTIAGHISQFSFHEQSGLQVNNLVANANINTNSATLDQLDITTPTSEIKDRFAFTFQNFHSFYKFVSAVKMQCNFTNSVISTGDLALFVPNIANKQMQMLVSGNLRGSIDNLKFKNIALTAGNHSEFYGEFNIRGLPVKQNLFLNVKVDRCVTDGYDLEQFVPGKGLQQKLQAEGQIFFKGFLDGALTDFNASGNLFSNMGNVNANLFMQLNFDDIQKTTYSGSLNALNFDVGKLISNDSLIGKITFNSQISNASGFSLKTFSGNSTANIASFSFNHYTYNDIAIAGNMRNKFFDGNIAMHDDNIEFNFKGEIDFTQQVPEWTFDADIKHADLKQLHFSTDSLAVSTHMNAHLFGDSINDITGFANLKNICFQKHGTSLCIDSLIINSDLDDIVKTITINSEILTCKLSGNFVPNQIPSTLISIAQKYFPSIPITSKAVTPHQTFQLKLNCDSIERAIQFFQPSLSGFNHTELTMYFNADSSTISANGFVPHCRFKQLKADSTLLVVNCPNHIIKINLKANDLAFNDTLHFPNPKLITRLSNDTVKVGLNLVSQTGTDSIGLKITATGKNKRLYLSFQPHTELLLQNKIWTISDGNSIVLGKNYISIKNCLLSNNDQSLQVTDIDQNGDKGLRFKMKNLGLNNFYRFVNQSKYTVDGLINGTANILHLFGSPTYTGDVVINKLTLNKDLLGDFSAVASYQNALGQLDLTTSLKGGRYDIRSTGYYRNTDGDSSLNMRIDLLACDAHLAQSFLYQYISDVQGFAGGLLYLKGNIHHPQVTGEVNVQSIQFKVNYLGTKYWIGKTKVEIKPDTISFKNVVVFDTSKTMSATMNGFIAHNNLKNFNVGLKMHTNNMQVLNTGVKDNPLFYGKAFCSGTFLFTGPFNNMEIDGIDLVSQPGTDIAIPISETSAVTTKDYIQFINVPGQKNVTTEKKFTAINGLKLNLNMTVNENANLQIIFNQRAGDIMRGTGNGQIQMVINTAGEFNMYGLYTVKKGDYRFTLQDYLFNKYFTVADGGTIRWDGDPYEAQIAISAIYSTKASVADLVPGGSSQSNDLTKPIPVNLYLNLTGSLLTPSVTFDIKTDKNSTNETAIRELDKIKQDENELNKQVFGILVLDRFIPSNISALDIGSQGVSTSLNDFIFSQASYYLSQLSGLDLKIDLNNIGDITGNSTDNKQKELGIALTQALFNNRVVLDVGGNIGLNNVASTNNLAGDFTLTYKITPDGKLSVKAFSKSEYDAIDERNKIKNGVGFSYIKDFETFHELFQKKNKSETKGQ